MAEVTRPLTVEVMVSPEWREDKQNFARSIAPRGWAQPEPVAKCPSGTKYILRAEALIKLAPMQY
jgi:hypothetical protein